MTTKIRSTIRRRSGSQYQKLYSSYHKLLSFYKVDFNLDDLFFAIQSFAVIEDAIRLFGGGHLEHAKALAVFPGTLMFAFDDEIGK